ncbi:MAG: hypothetical protein OEV42_17225 [Deltaproteobacteria bacterium]|nr:hypothetical protein [Deltaproteobacteria bacterium]
MKYQYTKRRKNISIIAALAFILFIGDTNLWADEREEGTYTIYGFVESVNYISRTFYFKTGEKVYLTNKTLIKGIKKQKVTFPELVKTGVRVGVHAKEVNGKRIAISIWKSVEG